MKLCLSWLLVGSFLDENIVDFNIDQLEYSNLPTSDQKTQIISSLESAICFFVSKRVNTL